MQRITIAPITGAAGTAKAVKRPETYAEALEVAATKEILGAGVKPARLFFSDGGEIENDSWELVGDKDFVYVSAGAGAPVGKNATSTTVAAPQPSQHISVSMAPAPPRPVDNSYVERLAAVRPRGNQLALLCIALHILGYCIGHLPFFVDAMWTINNTAGNTAFVMFVFIPSTAIWVTGLCGGVLLYEPWSKGCITDTNGQSSGCCCTDYRGRPNMGCAQVCSLTAMCLHAIIAYIETFLVANLQSWVLAVLIVKNVLCIVGELVGLSGACMLGNAIKDRPVQAGAAVPMAVTAVSAVSSTEGAEAV